ncbi:MAG: YeeE/YedE family protein [Anaerolineae bacterium]|nr:YeeE/YedE family protein [Anaerolineae bacterium]MCO5246455.1 YeeE/YedE family protein [Anaerolineae bacterium]
MFDISITAPQWIGLLIGFGIGAAAELWGIANPESIIRLARWKDRLFIGCVTVGGAVAVLTLYGLYALGVDMHFGLKNMYIWGILLGGILFGTGMAISGYFPGSEWMALGEGRRDALYAVPAGIVGALAWTLLSATAVGQWLVNTNNYGEILITGKTIAESTPINLFLLAIPFAALLIVIAWFTPRYAGSKHVCIRAQLRGKLGHDEDNPVLKERRDDNTAYLLEGSIARKGGKAEKFVRALSSEPNTFGPVLVVVAIAVGLFIVAGIILHQIFGESTTYSWLVSYMTPNNAYSQNVQQTIGWEPFSDVGTYLGAFFSALLISKRYTAFRRVLPPTWANRFGDSQIRRAIGVSIGSFMVLFGARMAGGCASGHILSGIFQMAMSGIFFAVVVIITMLIAARLIYRDCPDKVLPRKRSITIPAAQNVSGDAQEFVGGSTSEHKGDGNKYFNMMRDRGIAWMVIIGIIATVLVAIYTLGGYTGYDGDMVAWLPVTLIPLFLTLFASAFYSDRPAYEETTVPTAPPTESGEDAEMKTVPA